MKCLWLAMFCGIISLWECIGLADGKSFRISGNYHCEGKVDGFTVKLVTPHVLTVDSPGIETTYFRVVYHTVKQLFAISEFDGFKAPIKGKLSSGEIASEEIKIFPKNDAIRILKNKQEYICRP